MDPKIKAFLDLIAWSEGTSTHPLTKNRGYDVIVSGVDGLEVFKDYSRHPFEVGRIAKLIRRKPVLTSTASGRYQLLARFWRVYKEHLKLHDFSPVSQDAVAVQQIKERGAIEPILNGDIEKAIELCSSVWASLPGNDYRQSDHSVAELTAKYHELCAA